MDTIVTQDDLFDFTGYQRQGDLERWLRREGIKYFRARGNRLFTTATSLQSALDRRQEVLFDGQKPEIR